MIIIFACFNFKMSTQIKLHGIVKQIIDEPISG